MRPITFSGIAIYDVQNAMGYDSDTQHPNIRTAATFLVDGKDLETLPDEFRPSKKADAVLVDVLLYSPDQDGSSTMMNVRSYMKSGKLLPEGSKRFPGRHVMVEELSSFRTRLLSKMVNVDWYPAKYYDTEGAIEPVKIAEMNAAQQYEMRELSTDPEDNLIWEQLKGFALRLDTLCGPSPDPAPMTLPASLFRDI